MFDLEPVWSASLERSGAAPGLSSYQGRSSIYHSPSYEFLDGQEHKEIAVRSVDRRARKTKGQFDEQALAMLKRGMTYKGIAAVLGCDPGVPRRLARLHGMDRRAFGGHRPVLWARL